MLPTSSRNTLRAAGAAALGLLLAGACQQPAPPAPAAPQRVENRALGLAFTALPDAFEVATNEGAALAFTADRAGVPATVAVTVGARESSTIYLVERAKAFQPEVEAAGGKFHGGNELVTPFGSAYTVRATVDGGQLEERRLLMLHPADQDRLLQLTMRYPAGDPQAARDRLVQLMDLLAVMENLGAPAA